MVLKKVQYASLRGGGGKEKTLFKNHLFSVNARVEDFQTIATVD